MVDKTYNGDGWNGLFESLANSESYHVEHASSSELISHLKKHIKDIDFDDLMPLYDAVTDNERYGRHMMSEAEMLELINGDDP